MRICMHKISFFEETESSEILKLKAFRSIQRKKSLFSDLPHWVPNICGSSRKVPQGGFLWKLCRSNLTHFCLQFFCGVRKSGLGENFGLQHTSFPSILTLSFFMMFPTRKTKKIRSKNPPSTTLNYPWSPHRPRSFRNTQLLCQQPCQGQLANLGPRLQSMAPSILS